MFWFIVEFLHIFYQEVLLDFGVTLILADWFKYGDVGFNKDPFRYSAQATS